VDVSLFLRASDSETPLESSSVIASAGSGTGKSGTGAFEKSGPPLAVTTTRPETVGALPPESLGQSSPGGLVGRAGTSARQAAHARLALGAHSAVESSVPLHLPSTHPSSETFPLESCARPTSTISVADWREHLIFFTKRGVFFLRTNSRADLRGPLPDARVCAPPVGARRRPRRSRAQPRA
jgi:hypothetical protein